MKQAGKESMKRFMIGGAALAVLALIPALAFASGPKTGYYYATLKAGGTEYGNFTTQVDDSGKMIRSGGNCQAKKPNPAIPNPEVSITHDIKPDGSKFHYKGNSTVILTSDGPMHVTSEFSGKFTDNGKKMQASLSVPGCKPLSFEAKYIGKHFGG